MARQNISVEVTLEAAIRQYVKAMGQAEQATKDFTKELQGNRVQRFNAGLGELHKGALAVVGAFAGLERSLTAVVKAGLEFERVMNSLRTATGDARAAASEFAFLRETADDLGIDLRQSASEYASFLNAVKGTNLEGRAAREFFTTFSRIVTATGVGSEEAGRALTAFTQIVSKGTVQAEELTGQLGEAMPAALGVISRGLGTTRQGLLEMTSAGLDANAAIEAFTRQGQEEFGNLSIAAEGPQAAINRLNNEIYELQIALSSSGLIDAVALLAEKLAEAANVATFMVESFQTNETLQAFTRIGEQLRSVLIPGSEALGLAWAALVDQAEAFEQAQLEAAKTTESAGKTASEIQADILQLENELAEVRIRNADLQKRRAEELARVEQRSARETAQVKVRAANQALAAKERELEDGIAAEREYIERIEQLRRGLAETLASDEQRLAEIRARGLSDAERRAQAEVRSAELINQARRALREGDEERAALLAEEAKSLAEQVENVQTAEGLFEDAATVFKRAKEEEIRAAQAAAEAQRAANAETEAAIAAAKEEALSLKEALDELTRDPKIVTIDADISAAQARIRELQAQVDQLNRSLASGGRASGGPIGFAEGGAPRHLTPGLIRGPGTQTSDSILARVSAGEHAFITKASRAKQLWPLLNALNFGSDAFVKDVLANLPAGMRAIQRPIPIAGRYATGGAADSGLQPVNVFLPGGQQAAQLFGEREQIESFNDALARWSRAYTS